MADAKKADLRAADKEARAKDAALQAALKQIDKDFGQGSVMKLGDKSPRRRLEPPAWPSCWTG